MDRETIRKVKRQLENIADEKNLELERIIVFGSRVRDDFTEDSDIDILLVSDDFEGTEWYKRGGGFQRGWDYEVLPTPEIICLTNAEFQDRKGNIGDVVRKAFEEGIEV
jgi:hypothetical protein